MHDLIVIGGGPGGYVAAIRGSQLGLKVALIEKERLGGTCLNRGCIPTKAYYQQAEILHTLADLDQYGISSAPAHLDLGAALKRKNGIVDKLVGGIDGLLKGNGVEVINGCANIPAPGQVQVGDRVLETKNIMIATGSVNRRLSIPGLELPGVLDSTTALELETVPASMAIIGGGVIGVELAGIFQAFGCAVSIIEATASILPGQDGEISRRLNAYLKRQGIKVMTGTMVESIAAEGEGLVLNWKDRKGQQSLSAEKILLAAGREPHTEGLGLEHLDITMDGPYIRVNEHYRTSTPGIYAIGDVIPGPMLAHLASEEGRCAVENIAGFPHRFDYNTVPACIFSFPPVASVGLTEEEAQRKNITYRSGKFLFAANGKAMCMGETEGFVKVLVDEVERIIGVHVIGPHASDLILEATAWVQQGMSVQQIAQIIHPHPTLGEALQEAALDAVGQAIHLAPKK